MSPKFLTKDAPPDGDSLGCLPRLFTGVYRDMIPISSIHRISRIGIMSPLARQAAQGNLAASVKSAARMRARVRDVDDGESRAPVSIGFAAC